MTMMFNEIPVKRVKVSAYIEFEAYVYAEHEGEDWDPSYRIESDVTDAVEYHAGYGADAEDGDAIVAVAGDVVVDASVTDLDPDLTSDQLANLIMGRRSEASF